MSLRKSIALNTVYCVGAINTSKIDHSSKDNDAMMCFASLSHDMFRYNRKYIGAVRSSCSVRSVD